MPKYHNQKVRVEGRAFASAAEARRWHELRLLEQAGLISDLVCQPSFVIQPTFHDWQGKTVRQVSYVADFAYFDHGAGVRVIEDVKGCPTQAWRLKWKLAQYVWREAGWRWVVVKA